MKETRKALLFSRGAHGVVGGITRTTNSLASGLEKRGWTVATVHPGGERLILNVNSRRADVIEVAYPNLRISRGWFTSLRRAIRTALEIDALIAHTRPDVIVAIYVDLAILYPLIIGRIRKIPVIVSARGSDVHQATQSLRRRVFWTVCLLFATSATVKSDSMREDIRRITLGHFSDDKLHSVLDGVDSTYWSSTTYTRGTDEPTLLAVGVLRHVKGFDLLIEALALLSNDGVRPKTLVIGEGDHRQELEQLVRNRGLTGAIEFMGYQTAEQLREAYRQSSLFVLSSRNEGGANVLLEALACGLPAVSTDVGTSAEVIQPEAGLVVPAGDPVALAEGIKIMLERLKLPGDELEARLAARRAAEAVDWEDSVDEYEALMLEAMHRRHRGRRLGLRRRPRSSSGGRCTRPEGTHDAER